MRINSKALSSSQIKILRTLRYRYRNLPFLNKKFGLIFDVCEVEFPLAPCIAHAQLS